MSGKRITTQQVELYMTHRKQGDPQAVAAAKAGLSERTGRRVETGDHGPKSKGPRHWRTRKDPFEGVWDNEVVPRLEEEPRLSATTLFEALQDGPPRALLEQPQADVPAPGQGVAGSARPGQRSHVPPNPGTGPAGTV